MSQAGYCRREGLDQCTFSGWKRRLGWKGKCGGKSGSAERGRGCSGAWPDGRHKTKSECGQPAFFVPLRVAGRAACSTSTRLEVVLRNGRVVRCESSMAPRVLAAVAAALERDGAPC